MQPQRLQRLASGLRAEPSRICLRLVISGQLQRGGVQCRQCRQCSGLASLCWAAVHHGQNLGVWDRAPKSVLVRTRYALSSADVRAGSLGRPARTMLLWALGDLYCRFSSSHYFVDCTVRFASCHLHHALLLCYCLSLLKYKELSRFGNRLLLLWLASRQSLPPVVLRIKAGRSCQISGLACHQTIWHPALNPPCAV